MKIRIKRADTAEELAAVYQLRHQVFADEEGYMPPRSDGYLVDRFDGYPTTMNAIATVDGEVVGTIRGCEESGAGTPADEFFDFRPYLPDGARMLSASMYMVRRDYRDVPQLGAGMLGTALYVAVARGVTHVVAPCTPTRRELFAGLGFRTVEPEYFDEHHQLPVLPMMLDLDDLDDFFLDFLRRQEIDDWLDTFERQFHPAGDVVVRRGEAGDAAYVIIEGTAEVRRPNGSALFTLGRGDLFGELALLSAGPRTADVVATGPLVLMVLQRDDFQRQLLADPGRALRTLSVIAGRMTEGLTARGVATA